MEKLFVALAKLFNKPADVFTDEVKVEQFITSLDGMQIFTQAELDTLKKNQVDKAVELLADPKQQLPPSIYNRVKGTVHETLENRLKKKYGFSGAHTNTEELIEQLITTEVDKVKNDGELTKEVERLKKVIKDQDADYQTKIQDAHKEKESYIISDSLSKVLQQLPIDVTEDALDDARDIYLNNFLAKNKVSFKDGKISVTDKDGKIYQNKLGEPLDLVEVLKENRPSLIKFKDATGGRGDETKPPAGGNGLAGIKNQKDLDTYFEKNKINPNSPRAAELIKELIKANPDFKL